MTPSKNLWLIQTDKPSYLYKIGNDLTLSVVNSRHQNNIGRHIYITSDIKIKEGDYVYSTSQDYNIQKVSKGLVKAYQEVEHYKKIILTTDQDLIKYGVQSIPDDFLEWFVKNPSCEQIKIKEEKHLFCKHCDNLHSTYGDGINCDVCRKQSQPYSKILSYKIIIPKEEPKQETEHLLSTETNKKRLLEDVSKQETLEDFAKNYSSINYSNHTYDAVLAGAKWQMDKQDEFTLGFLHWYNTSQECETYLRRNYPKNITMNGEHYKKVLEINKELLEMYKNTLPR